jgi:hypothetical protein
MMGGNFVQAIGNKCDTESTGCAISIMPKSNLKSMMKSIALYLLLLIPFKICGQEIPADSVNYIYYTDNSGEQRKAVVATPPLILIVAGDSIFTVSNEFQLRTIMKQQEGFDIINHPDSISSFLRNRTKAIVILKKKK